MSPLIAFCLPCRALLYKPLKGIYKTHSKLLNDCSSHKDCMRLAPAEKSCFKVQALDRQHDLLTMTARSRSAGDAFQLYTSWMKDQA